MKLPRIATHNILTNKTDDLIYSWNTIKSIVNEVFTECFEVTRHGPLDTYKIYWRIGGTDADDTLYLTGVNPNFIVMHVFNNNDYPFFKIRFSGTAGVITIEKCIDVSNTQPFFTCDEGLTMMSDVADRIIGKLEETFGKKEEEKKMDEKLTYDALFTAAKEAFAKMARNSQNPTPKKKKGGQTFQPSVYETSFNKLIKDVYIDEPNVVIVFWFDGTKTVVTCAESDTFDPEIGICIAFMKKFLGNTGNYHQILRRVIKNAKNVTGEANKKREARKAKKEAVKREKEEEAEKRVDTLMNETQSPATIGFLNVEEE